VLWFNPPSYSASVTSIAELKRRMRRLREVHALTQQAFAQCAGLDYKFYQYIESPRKKQIWFETIDRIARTYGMENRGSKRRENR
jgi:transcriptional regulator with XRE-family HTH domain